MAEWLTTTTTLDRLLDFSDREIWRRFTNEMRAPVVRFARRMGLDPTEADDVAQETWLTFSQRYQAGAYDRAKGRLRTWLFGIACRKIRHSRSSVRLAARRTLNDTRSPNSNDFKGATTLWQAEWERTLLGLCLEQVRKEVEPSTYCAFNLVVRENRAPDEAALELGVSVRAVYNAKHRVLKRIRELMATEP